MYNRYFEPAFYGCTIAAAVLGGLAGLILGTLPLLLVAMVAAFTVEILMFLAVSQLVERRRLKLYMRTAEFQDFLRESGLRDGTTGS